MSSQDMLEDYNQINDFNPFIPGASSTLPGVSNADLNFDNSPGLPEARWTEEERHPCVNGEVRLGCNAPPHCPLDRNALPSYDIENGRWSLSGARCAHKARGVGVDSDPMFILTAAALLAFVYYLNRE